MAWSTRELAELAGTSLRTVRHYHDVGLLPEPQRAANGYKQYGVAHLVRLLRVKRLTDLGFSLSQIAAMGNDDDHPREALRALDDELAATIERLQRARVELAMILRDYSPTDLPTDMASAMRDAEMSAADRALVVVMSRVLSPAALDTYKELLERHDRLDGDDDFDDLPADADEQTRRELAERLVPGVRKLHADLPGLRDMGSSPTVGRAMAVALTDLYNPAQLDVLRRIHHALADD